jgi:hypothetical protein
MKKATIIDIDIDASWVDINKPIISGANKKTR